VNAIRALLTIIPLISPSDLETVRDLGGKTMQKVVPTAIASFKKGDAAARRDAVNFLTHANRLVMDADLAKQLTETLEAARTDPDAEVRYQARRPLRLRGEG